MDERRRNIENELKQVRLEINAHKRKLVELRSRRKILERKIYEPTTGVLRGADTFYVLTSEIRPSVVTWLELYNRQNGGMGGTRTLSERSGVSTRLIRKVTNGSGGKLVTLQTVDKLLTAIGQGYLIHDLTILETKQPRQYEVPEPPFSKYEEE